MKKIVSIGLLMILSILSFSQKNNSVPAMTRAEYLQKSKHQKTTATILLAGGAGCALIVPIAWGVSTKHGGGFPIIAGVFMAGLIAAPMSIPFFIAASRNKKRAMSLSFKNETSPQIHHNRFVTRSIPSITLKMNL